MSRGRPAGEGGGLKEVGRGRTGRPELAGADPDDRTYGGSPSWRRHRRGWSRRALRLRGSSALPCFGLLVVFAQVHQGSFRIVPAAHWRSSGVVPPGCVAGRLFRLLSRCPGRPNRRTFMSPATTRNPHPNVPTTRRETAARGSISPAKPAMTVRVPPTRSMATRRDMPNPGNRFHLTFVILLHLTFPCLVETRSRNVRFLGTIAISRFSVSEPCGELKRMVA